MLTWRCFELSGSNLAIELLKLFAGWTVLVFGKGNVTASCLNQRDLLGYCIVRSSIHGLVR